MIMSDAGRPLLHAEASVQVVAPSRWIEKAIAEDVITQAGAIGLEVRFSDQCFSQYHQLAGDDQERARAFEAAIADPVVDAVWFARGGYGAGRMMEHVDWSRLAADCSDQAKKVVIGYSDATPILETLSRLGLARAVHGSMPVDIASEANSAAPQRLLSDLVSTPRGKLNHRAITGCKILRPGSARGSLRGGNLTLLTKMLNGEHKMRFSGAILVIEDVEEYDYAIDRDLLCLRQAGALEELSGLIIGQFTKTIQSSVPFDQSVADMVLHHTRDCHYPILHGLQSGHGAPNEPWLLDEPVAFAAMQDRIDWEAVV